MKCIQPLTLDDVVLGQYVGDKNAEGDAKLGYLDDATVPKGSITPTFALGLCHINNERWEGVPFFLRCGQYSNRSKIGLSLNPCLVLQAKLSTKGKPKWGFSSETWPEIYSTVSANATNWSFGYSRGKPFI